jgi:hypothetical protein
MVKVQSPLKFIASLIKSQSEPETKIITPNRKSPEFLLFKRNARIVVTITNIDEIIAIIINGLVSLVNCATWKKK